MKKPVPMQVRLPIAAPVALLSLYALFWMFDLGLALAFGWDVARVDQGKRHVLFGLLVSVGLGLLGYIGVRTRHPAADGAYRQWLELSPWDHRLPLPLGRPLLPWREVISVLFAISLVLFDLWMMGIPQKRLLFVPAWMGMLYVLGTAIGAGVAFLQCGQFAQAWIVAALAPLVLPSILRPDLLLPLCAVLMVVVWSGVRGSLRRYPWPVEELRNDKGLGWTFTRLGPVRHAPSMPRGFGTAAALMVGWWMFVILSVRDGVARDPSTHDEMAGFCIFFAGLAACVRIGIYCTEHFWPLGPIARLRTGRVVIPDYDKVFITPAMAILAGVFVPGIFESFGLSPAITLGLTLSTILSLSTELGPTMLNWRMTGSHAISTLPTPDTNRGKPIPSWLRM